MVLDGLDRRILAALAQTGMGTLKLARRVEVCPMTVKRRVGLLIERGLVFADPRRFFAITGTGRAALGAAAPPRQPWVKVEAISAALSRDVQSRSPTDDRTAAQRSAHATMAAAKAAETVRLHKMERQRFAFGHLDMAG